MTRKLGTKKNRNARKHHCYVRIFDGRTREARAIQQIESELTAALGNDLSPMEALIVQRVAVKALRCRLAEAVIVVGDASPSLENDYLKWARELRSDLQVIGFRRRAKPVQSLEAYVEEKYGS